MMTWRYLLGGRRLWIWFLSLMLSQTLVDANRVPAQAVQRCSYLPWMLVTLSQPHAQAAVQRARRPRRLVVLIQLHAQAEQLTRRTSLLPVFPSLRNHLIRTPPLRRQPVGGTSPEARARWETDPSILQAGAPMLRGPAGSTSTTTTLFTALISKGDA